ncbi:MAG: hypothetical protein MKZ95_16710, partial [Pirellulales bacterium]|nr:hypothetical protein [Pirellulales bacterium]
ELIRNPRYRLSNRWRTDLGLALAFKAAKNPAMRGFFCPSVFHGIECKQSVRLENGDEHLNTNIAIRS